MDVPKPRRTAVSELAMAAGYRAMSDILQDNLRAQPNRRSSARAVAHSLSGVQVEPDSGQSRFVEVHRARGFGFARARSSRWGLVFLLVFVANGAAFAAQDEPVPVVPALPHLLSTDSDMGIAVVAEGNEQTALIPGETTGSGHWRVEQITARSVMLTATQTPFARARIFLRRERRGPVLFYTDSPAKPVVEALEIRPLRSISSPPTRQADAP